LYCCYNLYIICAKFESTMKSQNFKRKERKGFTQCTQRIDFEEFYLENFVLSLRTLRLKQFSEWTQILNYRFNG